MHSARQANKPSRLTILLDGGVVTDEVEARRWPGQGTDDDPYRIDWVASDFRNPMLWPASYRWFIVVLQSLGTAAVSLSSSSFAGAIPQLEHDLGMSTEVAVLTVSLFVLGFALGPMLWAPMSELYGRQVPLCIGMAGSTIFAGCSIASQSPATLIVLRFLAGSFGSCVMAVAPGIVADIFPPKERGLAVTIWCSAPFLGPSLGPLIGGFLSAGAGWKWLDAFTVIFGGAYWLINCLFVAETYAPFLLAQRAKRLTKLNGHAYKSKLEAEKGSRNARQVLSAAIVRPWVFLAYEPIVLFMSLYAAVIYGILYLTFAAFPFVFEEQRGWSQGIGGLSFLGMAVGQGASVVFCGVILVLSQRRQQSAQEMPEPEARLQPLLLGAPLTVIGLFWFAWTTYPSIHWIVPIAGSSLFGFGQVLMFIGMINYTVDAYLVYAASTLAASSILRALAGVVFPLFTTKMYENLGPQWASSVPAFLALLFAPFPFILLKYGKAIRARCKYSAEAQRIYQSILASQQPASTAQPAIETTTESGDLEKQSGSPLGSLERSASILSLDDTGADTVVVDGKEADAGLETV